MHIYFPDELFQTLIGIFFISIGLCAFTLLLWSSNLKQKWLNDHEGAMEEYEDAFKSAFWRMSGWMLFSFPISMLMVVGSSTYIQLRPSWYVPLVLFIMLVQVAFMFYLVFFPLCILVFTIAKIGAISINDYMKEKFPLKYL